MVKPRKLVFVGSIQLATFFLSFFILAPTYGTLGAAFSILLAFTASATISLIWSGRPSIKYTAFCCLSITATAGSLAGYVVSLIATEVYEIYSPLLPIVASVFLSIFVILASKNLSVWEVKRLVIEVLQRR